MEARTFEQEVVGRLLTSDTNAWGYFETSEGGYMNVGYANIGLKPQGVILGQLLLVGINECLVGYDLSARAAHFSYRMPLVFHEFVDVGDSLIVRDEMGFVGIALDGGELWKFDAGGVVANYVITSSDISGKTLEGLHFSFKLPRTMP
jgi:hypothetical protein